MHNASAASRANGSKHTSVVTTVAPETSGVPHAMVGTACCVSHPRWPVLITPPLRRLTDSSAALVGPRNRPASWRTRRVRRDGTPWAVCAGAIRRSGHRFGSDCAPLLWRAVLRETASHFRGLRARCGRHAWRMKKAPLPSEQLRLTHPPRIEHRAQPPHPAPRYVTIAHRSSKWDGTSAR